MVSVIIYLLIAPLLFLKNYAILAKDDDEMKIVLDAYGGDNSPHAILEGAAKALDNNKELELILTGNEDEIKQILAEFNCDMTRVEISDAREIITNNESPTEAIKKKKNSSLVRAMEITKAREDVVGVVTAGSTGATLTGGILKIGRLKGIKRPALAPILPTVLGGNCCLIDCGANVDSKPEFLEQFALMGVSYMRSVYGIENPRVALLSVGVEDKKGNELTKGAFPLLKNLPINFVGNMEACDALSGQYDVIVCDGFAGNILLKSTEGTLAAFMTLMKAALKKTFVSKIGALLVKKQLKEMVKSFGQDDNGGAAFLGVSKLLLKAHGSSKAKHIYAAINQVIKMAEVDLVGKIDAEFKALTQTENQ